MKQVKNSFNLLSRLSDDFLAFIIISAVVPLLAVFLLGLYFLFTEGYMLYFIGFTLLASLIILIFHLSIQKRKREKETLRVDEIVIEASPECSEFDDEMRRKIYERIDKKVEEGLEFQDFQEYSMEIVSIIAFNYNPKDSEKELAFSVPELLLALEVLSSKYRSIIIDYVPSYVSRIQFSSFKKLFAQKDKHGDKLGYAYDLYRLSRMLNPPVGILAELKGKIIDELLGKVSSSVLDKIKRALLKEMTYVAIELYRGGYKVKDSELGESKISAEDKTNKAMNIEPLRVTIVGQVNAGKSSVINASINKMVTEVSVMPSTDKIAVHECKIDGIDAINLIDLPGLDGDLEIEKLIIKQMTESDLVFWVVKANQSARKLDIQLRTKFDEFYKKPENLTRKRPTILLLVHQVDKLQPINEWNPPYDLINCDSSDKKCCIIRDTVKFNQETLKPDNILPLSLNPNSKFYNLDAIKGYLQTAYENGINTQLNRRRLEHPEDEVLEMGKKLIKLGKKIFEL